MVFDFISRIYYGIISPPKTPKTKNAIRFGLLGASAIAPQALITPAKTHPEVIVAAVAARDRSRAEKYAKQYDIPCVHDTYEALLADPSIECIYIALPNSYHYEWALRSLQAGKHVLLEKPSVSNAIEAHDLFSHPLLQSPDSPVLLEAFHYRFHPAWQTFLSLVHSPSPEIPQPIVCKAHCQTFMWKGFIPPDDIRLFYTLSGGCMMDFATYNLSCIRDVLRDPKPEVLSASLRTIPPQDPPKKGQVEAQVDEAAFAILRTCNATTGNQEVAATIEADMVKTGNWPWLPSSWTHNWPSQGWPKCVVELMPVQVSSGEHEGANHTLQRTLTLWNIVFLHLYHSIQVTDLHTVYVGNSSQVERSWTETKWVKAYDWPQYLKKDGRPGAEWWSTYRYQLEEFVNKVKKRGGGSGVWISGEDSIAQMECIDAVYRLGGLEIRKGNEFKI